MEAVGSIAAVIQVVLFIADNVLSNVQKRHKAIKSISEEDDVKHLKDWLLTIQCFVRDQETGQQRSLVSQNVVEKVLDITADIENALDEFMFSTPVHLHTNRVVQYVSDIKHNHMDLKPALLELASRRETINKRIEGSDLKDYLRNSVTAMATTSHHGLLRRSRSLLSLNLPQHGLVGFNRSAEELRRQLFEGPESERSIILVTGSGGSGKSFLVQNVYERARDEIKYMAWIKETGDGHNWVEELSKQMIPAIKKPFQKYKRGNAEQKFQDYFKERRYLIVLDDVWEDQDYSPVLELLPNNRCGSTIIIISRNSGVVASPSYSHQLKGLTEEEARELFSRAFEKESEKEFPPRLEPVSKKILQRCQGNPLAIAASARLLSEVEPVESEWEKIYGSLGSKLGRNSTLQVEKRVLLPSFYDLPYCLRSCLLYFSVFPEDKPVSRGRLIRSWMAEGFLAETNKPEEVAQTYLTQLVQRNVARVSSSEIGGRVKRSFHVLKLHHTFIVSLSNEYGFASVIGSDLEVKSVPQKALRRVSVQSVNFHTNLQQVSDLSRVKTLFVFGKLSLPQESDSFRSRLNERIKKLFSKDEMEKVFEKFRLLKVLDLEGVPLQQLPADVGSFVLLRCINLRHTELEIIPDSIQNLFLLESLDLKHTRVKSLPDWIRKLQNLRHLVVSGLDPSGIEQGVTVSSESIAALSYLQKLSLIKASDRKGFSIEDIGRLVQLKKLGLADISEKCGERVCNAIEKMKNLSKLDVRGSALACMKNPPKSIRSLHLEGLLGKFPNWIPMLSSLVKVVVKGSTLSDPNPFEGLEDLPCLMKLEMVECYTEETITFVAGKFQSLEKLHIEQFDNLTDVKVEESSLIKLESVTICKCKNLNPLPRIFQRLQDFVVY